MHAGRFVQIVQLQDPFNLIKREPQAFRFENKAQSGYVWFGVGPVSRHGSRRFRYQAFALIESDCLGRKTSGLGHLTDFHQFTPWLIVLDYKPSS